MKLEQPILSIITINRNNAKGLERTIKSVIAQSFKDYEWIVVDGASTDESVDVIKQYSDHFAYWVSEKDTGVYNAMNKGIKQAHGKYLQFLNSGDWLYDKHVYENIFSVPRDKDIFWGLTITFDQNGGQQLYGLQTLEFSAFELIGNMPHPSSFIKSALFSKYGPYDETYRIAGDAKFFFNAIVIHECSLEVINEPLVYFEGGGLSDQIVTGKREGERVIEDFLPQRLVKDYLIQRDSRGKLYHYQQLKQQYDIINKNPLSRLLFKTSRKISKIITHF